MRVRNSWTALLAWRSLTNMSGQVERSISHLSSGLRVQTAADDAAGMSISERMRSQYQGLVQANRNVMDGLSLTQTAESSLQEVNTLLQRARELAVQSANGVYTIGDRQSIQTEVEGIVSEIDRIADTSSFNGRRLLTPSADTSALANIINGLHSGWLEQSEKVIEQYYGLTGDGSALRIVLDPLGTDSAWISGTPNGTNGHLDNLELHINVADFGTVGGPDGGSGPVYNDRKVARALNEAVLARTTDYVNLSKWFISGTSDYIAGRNEQVAQDVAAHGAAGVVAAFQDAATAGNWTDDSLHRAAAYLAVRFLDSQLGLNGYAMADFMQALTTGASLDTALSMYYGTDTAGFIDDFTNVYGTAFTQALDLTSSDVGGIDHGDAHTVIPNGTTYTQNPLEHLTTDWSSLVNPDLVKPMQFVLQVGANVGETLTFEVPVISSMTLDLLGLDYVKAPTDGLNRVDKAISTVTGARATLGAVSNRLEHTFNANNLLYESLVSSYSRIRDLDIARSVSDLARQQILVSSSGAMLAQANTMRQNVKWLLNGMGGSQRFGLSGAG